MSSMSVVSGNYSQRFRHLSPANADAVLPSIVMQDEDEESTAIRSDRDGLRRHGIFPTLSSLSLSTPSLLIGARQLDGGGGAARGLT